MFMEKVFVNNGTYGCGFSRQATWAKQLVSPACEHKTQITMSECTIYVECTLFTILCEWLLGHKKWCFCVEHRV